jgi:hypothetical protein
LKWLAAADFTLFDEFKQTTNILINKWKGNSWCQRIMATGCWMAGKRSLHIDNVVYYQILAAEISMIESAIDRRAENYPRREDAWQPKAAQFEETPVFDVRFARYPPLVEELNAT